MLESESSVPRTARILNIAGKRFGKLTAIRYHHSAKRSAFWECRCECGNVAVVATKYLNCGDTSSCGCAHAPVKTKLGTSAKKTKGYFTWTGLIDRCHNPASKDYKRYGDRGITVCDRWRESFLAFIEDMGERPDGLSLERRDNDLGYFPDNCYWGTVTQQSRNRRSNTMITIDGHTKCLAEWMELKGISKGCYNWRVRHGWTPERALMTPSSRAEKGAWVEVVAVTEGG